MSVDLVSKGYRTLGAVDAARTGNENEGERSTNRRRADLDRSGIGWFEIDAHR
jgi:hypothetical protein